MKLVYKSGSGFWAALSSKCDKTIPQGKMHLHCLRLEIVEIGDEIDLDTSFTIVAGMPVDEPKTKELLLELRDHLVANFGLPETK